MDGTTHKVFTESHGREKQMD